MKRYTLLPILFVVAALLSGCGAAGRVKVTKTRGTSKPAPAPIEVFDARDQLERPFRAIAELSFNGVPGEYLDVVREFAIKARRLGADAILMQAPVSFTGERAPAEHVLFRATAIAYEDKGVRAAR